MPDAVSPLTRRIDERLFTTPLVVMCGFSFTVFLSAFQLFPTAPFRILDTLDRDPPAPEGPATVQVEDLKAVFFVRSFEGTREYREHKMRYPGGCSGGATC